MLLFVEEQREDAEEEETKDAISGQGMEMRKKIYEQRKQRLK